MPHTLYDKQTNVHAFPQNGFFFIIIITTNFYSEQLP